MALAERLAALEGGVGGGLHLVGARGADHGAVPADAARATTSSPRPGSTAAPSPSSPTPSAASAGRREFVDTEDLAALEDAVDDRHPGDLLRESIANPGGYVTDIPALAEVAKRDRRAADRRQHLGDALPLPADRDGGRHRRAFDDEVPDRQRHRRRRRAGRRRASFDWSASGKFPSLTEPEPAYHGLKFHETFGPMAYTFHRHRHRAARPRHDDGAAERLPDAARHRDAEPADAASTSRTP